MSTIAVVRGRHSLPAPYAQATASAIHKRVLRGPQVVINELRRRLTQSDCAGDLAALFGVLAGLARLDDESSSVEVDEISKQCFDRVPSCCRLLGWREIDVGRDGELSDF